MDKMKLLQEIFQVCIIPLLGVLTTYLISFIKSKKAILEKQNDNELYRKYINMLDETITKCVIATNQTYVDSLKNQNAFTKEAQEEAFKKTYEAVMAILSKDAQEYLTNAVGDLNTYITNSIQAQVKINKIVKASTEESQQ